MTSPAPSPASGQTLLLVGCGKMGQALLSGWLVSDLPLRRIVVLDTSPDIRSALPDDPRLEFCTDIAALPVDLLPDYVLLAVKPQQMEQVLEPLKAFAARGSCFLSIAAGKPLAWFADRLGSESAIVRAMPNTPAAVGRGITVLVANSRTGQAGKDMCGRLMQAVGAVEWVDDEGLMDAVTALSGGGPAYVFLLIEALAEAGVQSGLPPELSMRLARTTVCGAGELARLASEDPATLRKNVTSPGGTTKAALDVLMKDDGLQPLLNRAIGAATARSRELAG